MNQQQRKIIALIKAIRESFAEAKIVYNYGGCYGFYKILKEIYPKAEAYNTESDGHVLTKIGKEYYDIAGISQDLPEKKPLSEKQHSMWDANVCGMRAEEMILRKIKKNRI